MKSKPTLLRSQGVTRRRLLGGVAVVAASPGIATGAGKPQAAAKVAASDAQAPLVAKVLPAPIARPLWSQDGMADAAWLWYPSERALPSSFVLFRKDITLPAKPTRAPAWISADSRYLLTVNGKRVQFGPAPCDPRQLEVDPVDLAPYLGPGKNVIGATVLFYGVGDGTWVLGKPGFLMFGNVEFAAAAPVRFATDPSWQCHLSRAWQGGRYRRSYLRALQEQFDARLHPQKWDQPGFVADASWRPAMKLEVSAGRPPLASTFRDDIYDVGGTRVDAVVQPRTIASLVANSRFEGGFWLLG